MGCLAPTYRLQTARTTEETQLARNLDAIFYVLRIGCPWRLLPREFPPWETVYYWFRRWRIDGAFERLNRALGERLRAQLGRKRQPTAGLSILSLPRRAGSVAKHRASTAARRFVGAGDTCS